jgi:hypothetical protein
VEWVEVGRACDECLGTGELLVGVCGICPGDGYLIRVVTLAEFRALARGYSPSSPESDSLLSSGGL